MSLIDGPIYGGAYLGSYGLSQPSAQPVQPQEPAKPSEPLEREQTYTGVNLGGFGKAPPACDLTWWRQRCYPTCALAFAVVAGPIFAGTRTATLRNADGSESAGKPRVNLGAGVQVTETPEEKRRKLVEDVFEDAWPDILNGLECYNFGRWTQEAIWDRKLGVVAPVRFKSFLPWEVQLQRDKFNDFAGYKHNGIERDARYAFHVVCQPHFDPIFGTPRAENARESWWRAMQSQENGDKIERKASGIQMWLELPTGVSWTDASGNPVLKATMVQTIVNAAAQGATFTTPIPWTKEQIQAKPELMDKPLIRVQQFNWGETGPALIAAIARLDRLDKEIFRAWHRPEREAMEGDHGTKAEAGVHGQVGITDSEKAHGDFLRQFNRQVLNRFLVTNFGPDAADTIYFKPTPLVDAQQAFKQQVVSALIASPTAGPELQANLDGRRLLKETEVPLLPENEVVMPQPAAPPKPVALSASGDGEHLARGLGWLGRMVGDE
jgi:hypothetical protein